MSTSPNSNPTLTVPADETRARLAPIYDRMYSDVHVAFPNSITADEWYSLTHGEVVPAAGEGEKLIPALNEVGDALMEKANKVLIGDDRRLDRTYRCIELARSSDDEDREAKLEILRKEKEEMIGDLIHETTQGFRVFRELSHTGKVLVGVDGNETGVNVLVDEANTLRRHIEARKNAGKPGFKDKDLADSLDAFDRTIARFDTQRIMTSAEQKK